MGVRKPQQAGTGRLRPIEVAVAMSFSPDGTKVGATGLGAILWDAATGERVAFKKDVVGTRAVRFLPGSNKLLLLGAQLRLWDVEADSVTAFEGSAEEDFTGLAINADGTLACAGDESAIVVWDIAAGNVKHRLDKEGPGRF